MNRTFAMINNNEMEKLDLLAYSYSHRVLIEKQCNTLDQLMNQLTQNDSVIILSLFMFKNIKELSSFLYLLIEKRSSLTIIKDDINLDFSNRNELNVNNQKLLISMYNYISTQKEETLLKRQNFGGRKKGQKVKSKYDDHKARIFELHALGLSLQKICDNIGIGTKQSLANYIHREKGV